MKTHAENTAEPLDLLDDAPRAAALALEELIPDVRALTLRAAAIDELGSLPEAIGVERSAPVATALLDRIGREGVVGPFDAGVLSSDDLRRLLVRPDQLLELNARTLGDPASFFTRKVERDANDAAIERFFRPEAEIVAGPGRTQRLAAACSSIVAFRDGPQGLREDVTAAYESDDEGLKEDGELHVLMRFGEPISTAKAHLVPEGLFDYLEIASTGDAVKDLRRLFSDRPRDAADLTIEIEPHIDGSDVSLSRKGLPKGARPHGSIVFIVTTEPEGIA